MRAFIVVALLTTAPLLAAPGVSLAATPGQATARIGSCVRHAGALKVTPNSHGAVAYFARPFSAYGRWISWSYVTSPNGRRVIETMTMSHRLTPRQGAAFARCLRGVA
jgi:hypothetical protein